MLKFPDAVIRSAIADIEAAGHRPTESRVAKKIGGGSSRRIRSLIAEYRSASLDSTPKMTNEPGPSITMVSSGSSPPISPLVTPEPRIIDAATRIAPLEATIAELTKLLNAERARNETYSASVERMRSIIVELTGAEIDRK